MNKPLRKLNTLIKLQSEVTRWVDKYSRAALNWQQENQESRKLQAETDRLVADKDEQAGRLMQYDSALKQAREALHIIFKKHTHIKNHDKYRKTHRICAEALAEIDKVLGGKEDV